MMHSTNKIQDGKENTIIGCQTYLRRWENMSIISNSDFTHSSREKSSNYQKNIFIFIDILASYFTVICMMPDISSRVNYLADSCKHTGVRHHLRRDGCLQKLALLLLDTQLNYTITNAFSSHLGTYSILQVGQNKGVRGGTNHRLLHQSFCSGRTVITA